MKTYIIKVKDSEQGDLQDYAIEVAKRELSKRKTGYAAIYGYTNDKGRFILLHEPLIKYSEAEVKEFENAITNGKKSPKTVVHAIYRQHLDDSTKHLLAYRELIIAAKEFNKTLNELKHKFESHEDSVQKQMLLKDIDDLQKLIKQKFSNYVKDSSDKFI